MIALTAYYKNADAKFEIEFDSENSTIEVLHLQLFSVVDADVFIVDYAGRSIDCVDDLWNVCADITRVGDASTPQITKKQASIWICDKSISVRNNCSLQVFQIDEKIIQPLFRVTDTTFSLCMHCVNKFDSSMVSPCTGTITPFHCACQQASEFGFSLTPYSSPPSLALSTPLKLYFKRQYLMENTRYQRDQVQSNETQQFRGRLMSCCETVKRYEEVQHQLAAKKAINMETILQYATEHKSICSTSSPATFPGDDVCFMTGLLRWFKCDFFKWTNSPACDNCSALGAGAPPRKGMSCIGMAEPNEFERDVCWAQRVELHQCKACQFVTRFPRVNNPSVLVTSSRRGRCGEWANAFCLICRTLGIDALYCMDWTDHVWVEVWLPSLGRYVHVDRHSVVDTTARYTRKYNDVLLRRESLGEKFVDQQIKFFDKQMSDSYMERIRGPGVIISATNMWGGSLPALLGTYDVSLMDLIARKKSHARELLGFMFSSEQSWRPEESIGRISGDDAWKRQRGEEGKPHESDDANKTSNHVAVLSGIISHLKMDDTCNKRSITESTYCTPWLYPGFIPPKMISGDKASDIVVIPDSVALTPTSFNMLPVPSMARKLIRSSIMHLHAPETTDSNCQIAYAGVPIVLHSSLSIGENRRKSLSGIIINRSTHGALMQAVTKEGLTENEYSVFSDPSVFIGTDATEGLLIEASSCVLVDGHHGLTASFLAELDLVRYRCPWSEDNQSCDEEAISFHRIDDCLCIAPIEVVNLEDASSIRNKKANSPPEVSTLLDEYLHRPDVVGCSLDPTRTLLLLYGSHIAGGQILKMCPGAVTYAKRANIACPDEHRTTSGAAESVSTGGGMLSVASDRVHAKSVGFDVANILCTSESKEMVPSIPSKSISPSVERCECIAESTFLYISMSSRQAYPDTQHFDTTQFLGSLIPIFGSEFNLAEVVVHAGPYMNGVSCSYDFSSTETGITCKSGRLFPSVDLFGENDYPDCTRIKINSWEDPIISVTVKSGGWVDSLQFTTKNGVMYRFGGDGGSETRHVDIPEGFRLVGFYGGVGGHLHNIGIVIESLSGQPRCVLPNSATYTSIDKIILVEKLLEAFDRLILWNASMFSFNQLAAGYKQPDIGALLSAVLFLFENNSMGDSIATVKAIAAYTYNIIKDVRKKDFRKVKLVNKYFKSNILSSTGGISLFLFGPACFRCAYDDASTQCILKCTEPLTEEEGGSILVQDWLRSLQQYYDFLMALPNLCSQFHGNNEA